MSKNILLFAYAISPVRGSEYAVSWNYLIEMSKEHRLTVLYGTNKEHLGEFEPIEILEQYFPSGQVHFVPIPAPRLVSLLNILNRKGICGYSFYIAYYFWQFTVFQTAAKLVTARNFDLIHYLGPIGYREPGYLWKLQLPYIWGPVGGLRNISPILLKTLPPAGRMKLTVRSIINHLQQKFSFRVKRAFKRADVVLAATEETCDILQKRFHISAEYLPENGIIGEVKRILPNEKFYFQNLELIWIGRLDANKSLKTLLDSLKQIKDQAAFHLNVVGDGPLKKSLVEFAEATGINGKITWQGRVVREQVFHLLQTAHIHVITSCNEANSTVLFEAMATGIPTISLDHCGMHDIICEHCGIRIPICSYEQIVTDLGEAIIRLYNHPEEVKRLSEGVVKCAAKYTWDKRREFFNRQYDIAIRRFQSRHQVGLQ